MIIILTLDRKDEQTRTDKIIIDTTFDFYTDANDGDPNSTSPTLRSYHQLLWSKPLPNS